MYGKLPEKRREKREALPSQGAVFSHLGHLINIYGEKWKRVANYFLNFLFPLR
jgi:hypothetical protein